MYESNKSFLPYLTNFRNNRSCNLLQTILSSLLCINMIKLQKEYLKFVPNYHLCIRIYVAST